jgi:hypothetical protein
MGPLCAALVAIGGAASAEPGEMHRVDFLYLRLKPAPPDDGSILVERVDEGALGLQLVRSSLEGALHQTDRLSDVRDRVIELLMEHLDVEETVFLIPDIEEQHPDDIRLAVDSRHAATTHAQIAKLLRLHPPGASVYTKVGGLADGFQAFRISGYLGGLPDDVELSYLRAGERPAMYVAAPPAAVERLGESVKKARAEANTRSLWKLDHETGAARDLPEWVDLVLAGDTDDLDSPARSVDYVLVPEEQDRQDEWQRWIRGVKAMGKGVLIASPAPAGLDVLFHVEADGREPDALQSVIPLRSLVAPDLGLLRHLMGAAGIDAERLWGMLRPRYPASRLVVDPEVRLPLGPAEGFRQVVIAPDRKVRSARITRALFSHPSSPSFLHRVSSGRAR